MTQRQKTTAVASVTSRRKRVVGVDAARGLALTGMVAIHVMPGVSADGGPTFVWTVGAGIAAALFSFLAGVSLALSTGGSKPVRGRALNGARIGTAVRAAILILLGLLLALADPPVAIILAYYGVMFLLAIPLLGAGPGTLFALAAAFAVFGSTLLHFIAGSLPDLDGFDPSLGSLLTQPDATLSAVFANGSYPALAWMAFICAGMAVGRLDLSVQDTQLRLMVGGLTTALATWAVSTVVVDVLGGYDRILAGTPGLSDDQLVQALVWGPDDVGGPQIASDWWLFALSPYSETPLEMLHVLGWAVFAFGTMLLIGSRFGWLVTPLALVGTMTLTLYCAHLLLLAATGRLDSVPHIWYFWLQIGVALLFVVLWRNILERTQGPLEWVTTTSAKGVRDRYLNRTGRHRY